MPNFNDFRSAVLRPGAKSIVPVGQEVKSTSALAEVLSSNMKEEKRLEADYDVQKCLEAKSMLFRENKANEIMHTGNTGYGAELIQGAVTSTDFLDFAPTVNPLLARFKGFHGRNMNMTEKVVAIGELPFHQLMPEQTTGAFAFVQGLGKLPTDKVQIDQKQYFFSVDVSEAEARFSIIDLLAVIKVKLAASAARTIIASIINGDPTATATTNINTIDGTPSGTEYYMGGTGLRKTCFANASTQTLDIGTLDFTDFLSLQNLLGENGVPEELVYIMGTSVKNKALGISEFLATYQNGLISTAVTGKLPEFLGSQYSVQRDLTKANTAGKVATGTPANNTKGQMLCVHENAPQWGFNGDYNVEIYRVPGKGYQVIGWYFMGYAIANAMAGTDPTVALGFNITV